MSEGDYAELYRDTAGEFRTRVCAANHEVIFDSGEGYTNKLDAVKTLASRFPEIEIRDLTGPDTIRPF